MINAVRSATETVWRAISSLWAASPKPATPYDEGYEQYLSATLKDLNPYSQGSAQHDAWERGYRAAYEERQW